MSAFSTKLCGVVVLWLAVLCVAAPDAVRVASWDDAALRAQSGSSARERWDSLSPAQRARVQQRFERLKSMQAGERAELEKRAKRLHKIERRIVASLSEADRARLMQQPAEKRSQLLAELVEAELRSRGARIEAKLPPEVRDWLAQASPDERRARLEEFKLETRERTSVAAVEQVAAALGFGETEIARLKRLPVEDRMRVVLDLNKRLSKEQIEEAGLPKGLTAKRWRELDRLPPREYFAEIMALRAEGLLGDALRGRRGAQRVPRELREASRDLERKLEAKPRERLELSELSPEERRHELDRRRRARVMNVVRERAILNERQIEVLEAMEDHEFFRHVRRVADQIGRGKRPRVEHPPAGGADRPPARGVRRGDGGGD